MLVFLKNGFSVAFPRRQKENLKMKKLLNYFSLTEKLLWALSVLTITVSFLLFDGRGYIYLVTSLIGVTFLIFCAKGNPIGQALTVVFGIMYSVISFSYAYYGEMITYLGMTVPAAVLSLISWIRHPYNGKKSEVKVNRVTKRDFIILICLTGAVTAAFYFILKLLNTSNLAISTASVTTSFIAVFFTFKRSPYYALGYALNDIVLIIMWVLAAIEDISCISVVICFSVFLVNDIYGFINWQRLQKKQSVGE